MSTTPNLLEQLHAAHDRQVEVADDQRRVRPAEHLEPLVPVAGEQAVVAGGEEDLAEQLAVLAVVLDDQDVARRRRPVGLPVLAMLDDELAALERSIGGHQQLVDAYRFHEVSVRASFRHSMSVFTSDAPARTITATSGSSCRTCRSRSMLE